MNLSRRSVLRAGAGALAGGTVAGCLSELDDGGAPEGGYAAFFTLWDWTERVAGDALSFENPVPTGAMGHGWEPDAGLTADVAEAGAFVYLDSAEFGWAQDVAATLESDYGHVAVVDVLEGLEGQLIGWDEDGREARDDRDHDGHDHDGNDHDHQDEGDDHHDDHADDEFDPHVWLDPVLATEMVDVIADGLSDAAPDDAETFAENAESYAEELAALDEQFRELVEEAEHDAAVLASHDSFRYVERRYGFDLHTPTGVSPNEEPSHEAVADTLEFVDDRGIDVILYDAFESSRLAESIVAESTASEVRPLTPLSGTTGEWDAEGWGYLEQMQEINVPAFREALGAQYP